MEAVSYINMSKDYYPDPKEPVFKSIFEQYERVIFESIISSFGLDFIVQDQHGGDVDTVHNVRAMKDDCKLYYKSKKNEQDYQNHGKYDVAKYHGNGRFIKIKKDAKTSFNENGEWLKDTYTGEKIAPNKGANLEKQAQLDHVIAAKDIHDDAGRVLAGLTGTDLANNPDNLRFTNACLNNNMKDKTIPEYLKWCEENPDKVNWNGQKGAPMPDDVRNNLMKEYERSKRAYDKKVNHAYYTSPKFAKDLSSAAAKRGMQMGVRQALGFIFMEIWLEIKEEFEKAKEIDEIHMGEFFHAIGNGVKQGYDNAKLKYAELFECFISGAVAGAMSSITTTICNIFFTTAKNTVKIIRQSYASLVQAAEILFINPDNYLFGDRMQAVVKILATGASVVVGVVVNEAIEKTPIAAIPVVGKIVPTFCSSFITGIMSCTLLYYIDQSKTFKRMTHFLNNIPTVETEISFYHQQAEALKSYAAELMRIDIGQFKEEERIYRSIVDNLESAKTEAEFNTILKDSVKRIGVIVPWGDHENFDAFLKNKKNHMVFE